MCPMRFSKLLMISLLIPALLTACGTAEDEGIAVSVALTQTAAARKTAEAPPKVTEEMPAVFEGDLQPLDPAECDEMASTLSEMLEVPVEQRNVAVEFQGKSGGGCQVTGVVTGANFADMLDVEAVLRFLLNGRGMAEFQSAEACLGIGGWGPGANVTCYAREYAYCGAFVHVDPVDPSLCSDDEPITVCLEGLAPEQVIYTADLTCAHDTAAGEEVAGEIVGGEEVPAAEPVRLIFAPGEESISVYGQVTAGGYDRYVLTAMEGQQMTVNLLDASRKPIATDTVALAIWGADGTVLISDHAGALTWTGELPFTQDYYIDVNSSDTAPISYVLETIIPPLPPSGGEVFPQVEPFPFGEMQTIVLSGVPPMLPAEFPVEEGQPEIVAYVLTSDEGLYEISLDYGVDCMGAGACHYGSTAGLRVDSTVPVGTPSFPFDMEEAQIAELEYGITGYFIESVCGASCDDSRVWWVYEGYQYMLGLKGGQFIDLTTLADAAIMNSIP